MKSLYIKNINLIIVCFLHLMGQAQNVRLYDKSSDLVYDSIPYMVNDTLFESAYTEMVKMFHNDVPYSLKRAEFLVENSFYGGTMNYLDYCHEIDSVTSVLRRFIEVNNIGEYKTAPNFAIFEYFTKPSIMNGNRKFSYDFENPTGEKDFRVMFVSNLLHTHIGQCTSMPLLYKILCDELGGQSALAFGPMHLYVKHIGEDGRWVNVELTHGGFVRDAWLMESMNISTEAIRNGIFLCALNEKENIAFMMMQLARAYQSKYKSYDYYVERCVETVLDQLPNFCDALIMKFNLYHEQGYSFQSRFGYDLTPFIKKRYETFRNIMNKLDSLGYSQQR